MYAAAVDPNNQPGRCGPYYIWYQTGPDSHVPSPAFVDLYSITFDISDVVDDFDFVYFTGERASLDTNSDGISDQHFKRVNGNQLEWKPIGEYLRTTEPGCWDGRFNERCAYVMISIQPKKWFSSGSADIPIHVSKKCSPSRIDCSETHVIRHEYRGCKATSIPEFIIQQEMSVGLDTEKKIDVIKAEISIENTAETENGTHLTTIINNGTKGGRPLLFYFNIECPKEASCKIENLTNEQFDVSLSKIPAHGKVLVSYNMEIDKTEIELGNISYFITTATLARNGGSDQSTVSVAGSGTETPSGEPERRPERPRQSQ